MYKIEEEEYGYQLIFGDFIKLEEMSKWVDDSKRVLLAAPKKEFGIFVDMRDLKPMPADAQVKIEEGQKLYRDKGMTRSVVVLASKVLAMQFKRIAKDTGIYEYERYIDASSTPDWREKGEAWLKDAVDPDL